MKCTGLTDCADKAIALIGHQFSRRANEFAPTQAQSSPARTALRRMQIYLAATNTVGVCSASGLFGNSSRLWESLGLSVRILSK